LFRVRAPIYYCGIGWDRQDFRYREDGTPGFWVGRVWFSIVGVSMLRKFGGLHGDGAIAKMAPGCGDIDSMWVRRFLESNWRRWLLLIQVARFCRRSGFLMAARKSGVCRLG